MADLTGMATGCSPAMVQVRSAVYGFNGANRLRAYDGVSWRLAGIERAPFIPGVATSGAGNLIGRYRYYVVPTNSKKFTGLNQPQQGLPSLVSDQVECNNNAVAVSGIPSTHPDSQVDYWYIYRNKAGEYDETQDPTKGAFFYVGRVAIGTTSYTDNLADYLIVESEKVRFDTNLPATCVKQWMFGERLIGLGFKTFNTGTATLATKTVNNKALTSNVATLQTSAAHGYSVGDWVCINIGDVVFDGPVLIKATPSGTTFTYDRRNPDVASVAASGTSEKVTLSSGAPDGVRGAWFQKAADGTRYRIVAMQSGTGSSPNGVTYTSIVLDRGFSGALSAASFTIYREGKDVFLSAFGDPESGGPDGEAYRYRKTVPGYQDLTNGLAWNGKSLLFTVEDIWLLEGKSPDIEEIRIAPEPFYRGLGAVGYEAVWREDNEVFFMSLQGPAVIRENGQVELIGNDLLQDWLDGLTQAEKALCVVVGNSRRVRFIYPNATGDTENSKAWTYYRNTGRFWPERNLYASRGYRFDGDGGTQGEAEVVIGRELWRLDDGSTDGATSYSGVLTGATTTTATDSGASFPTTNGGLENYVVRFYRTTNGVEALVGTRRIAAGNTGTVISWASSGVGGGTLSVQTGDRYEIGNIAWGWKTKTFQVPGHASMVEELRITNDSVDSNKTVIRTDYRNGVQSGNPMPLAQNQLVKIYPLHKRVVDAAFLIESRTGAKIRSLELLGDGKPRHD